MTPQGSHAAGMERTTESGSTHRFGLAAIRVETAQSVVEDDLTALLPHVRMLRATNCMADLQAGGATMAGRRALALPPTQEQREADTAFTLTQVRRHGPPFVLLVDAAGVIHGADRRSGWRDMIAPVRCGYADRVPDALVAVIDRHRLLRSGSGTPTIEVLGGDVVVAILTLNGPSELFACSIARFRRGEAVAEAQRCFSLTDREAELLERILTGEQSADIARALTITLATVEWHTKRLLYKTFSQNRTHMVARVLGWVHADE